VEIDAVVSFTRRLVATESPSGQEGAVAALVREEMERLGYSVEVDALGNVVGTLGDGDGPCVLLDAHMDTVGVTDRAAWSADPAGELRDGKLYGRGSVDMKGPLAAVVHGAAAAAARGRVVVSASIAEEMIEGHATVEIARRVRPDVAVICEPSHRTVVVGQRGRAELIVEVGGRPSHSSMPSLGVNAVEAMADILVAARELAMPEHPALGPGILVVTDVISRPYPALSVLPDRCTATFDRRTLPGEGEEEVLGQLRDAAEAAVARHGATARVTIGIDRFDAYTGTPVEAPNFAPAWYTGADAPVARAALAAVGGEPGHWLFCTNGSGTAALGIPTIGFGPGDETLAHRVDEHIELAELEAGARGYAALVEALTA
jgi:putative selenium metabolism hydrolase